MSIERIERDRGVVWRVRWREGGRNRSKLLGRKRDADAFDAEIRRRKRTGELVSLDAGKQTVAEFAEEWWRVHAVPNLSRRTLEVYASLWDLHVLPRLGGMQLRELNAEVAQRFAADLAAAGVGPAARRKALALTGAVLQRAVEWGRIPANPMRMVRKPPARPERRVRPISPSAVEAIRALLLADGRQRDATLVCLLAYAGLRPGEALGLRWRDVGERTLLVERAVSDGEIKTTKTGQLRAVRLLKPLRDDLDLWRLASPRADDEDLVFPTRAGEPWREHDWRNWRRRTFEPVAEAVGLTQPRPYDLRHSFVSLLIHEGRSIVEVAAQAGHAPTMALSTYAHVFAELEGTERVSAEEQIRAARDEDVPVSYLESSAEQEPNYETPANDEALFRTRTGDPFLTMKTEASPPGFLRA
jgi:integrase